MAYASLLVLCQTSKGKFNPLRLFFFFLIFVCYPAARQIQSEKRIVAQYFILIVIITRNSSRILTKLNPSLPFPLLKVCPRSNCFQRLHQYFQYSFFVLTSFIRHVISLAIAYIYTRKKTIDFIHCVALFLIDIVVFVVVDIECLLFFLFFFSRTSTYTIHPWSIE